MWITGIIGQIEEPLATGAVRVARDGRHRQSSESIVNSRSDVRLVKNFKRNRRLRVLELIKSIGRHVDRISKHVRSGVVQWSKPSALQHKPLLQTRKKHVG